MSEIMQSKCEGHLTEDHLTEKMMTALVWGRLGQSEKIKALDHVAGCKECSERFAAAYENIVLLELPPQFCDEVRVSLRRYIESEPNQDRVEPQIKKSFAAQGRYESQKKSDRQVRKKEYWRYSFRVVLAACFTMVILFSNTFSTGVAALNERMMNPDFSHIDKISQGLNNFSNHVLNWEAN